MIQGKKSNGIPKKLASENEVISLSSVEREFSKIEPSFEYFSCLGILNS